MGKHKNINSVHTAVFVTVLCLSFAGCLKRNPQKITGLISASGNSTSVQTSTSTSTSDSDSCASSAPDNPANLTVTSSSSPASVSMSWTNPSDCRLKGVLIKRKTGSSPSNVNDGISVDANSDNAGFTDSSVSTGNTYYYKIFLYNGKDQYSSGTGAAVRPGSTTLIPSKIADSSIILDGLDSETAWSGVPKIDFSFPVVPTFTDYTGGNDLNVTGYIKFAYDTNYFYIYYHTDDKYLRVDNAGTPWTDDSIEVFFDMGFNRTSVPDTNDYHLIMTPRSGASYENYGKGTGTVWGVWSPSIVKASNTAGSTLNNDADTDSGWNLEVQIPFTDLGISSISPGQVIGFTFWVNDDDLSAFTGTQHYFRWTTGTLSANPSTWGILQF
ncbi:MAG TPA: sugar-binding protein [Leptospiraceae bacterium]|nr:sugar-binding protein [Leptospiraceae bacterium]HNF24053.1 sugar-binding protein [Leptospiraceae bacterium]HNI98327.1 sugar-binding protein [Leptospiraceae bacterium]HNN02009.1 sugar-binding protein [Leptospiraceae bacterium]